MGFLEVFWVFLYVFRGVPGFLEGVPGCSGFSRRCSVVFQVFHTVPGVPGCSGVFRGVPVFRVPVFRCSGVPVFRCSGVPGITTCRKSHILFCKIPAIGKVLLNRFYLTTFTLEMIDQHQFSPNHIST